MMIDSQDPFNLNNLVRMNLQSREDELLKLGRSADIYERLTASLAPSIWQMEDVKKGILCQLFGAATKVRPCCPYSTNKHTPCDGSQPSPVKL